MSNGQSPDIDLDATDRLPVLQGVFVDPDVMDDAVPMDDPVLKDRATALIPTEPRLTPSGVSAPRVSTPPIDLPSLAESVRSVEERIDRQHAEYEALKRTHERTRLGEAAANARVNLLERDLATVRSALETEQNRSREIEGILTEKIASSEAARTHAEEVSRDAERFRSEALTLRESVASKDAKIVEALHSLGERNAQLSALQAEHANMVPALEARAQNSTQLEKDLVLVRAQLSAVSLELKASQEKVGTLGAELTRKGSEASAVRAELLQVMDQNSAYLERLRSRDWRNGFELNLYRDLDARAVAADASTAALIAERDRLASQVGALEATNASQRLAIEKLQSAATAHANYASDQAQDVEQGKRLRAEWDAKLSAAEAEQARLTAELAARDHAFLEAQKAASAAEQNIALLNTGHAAKIAELKVEAATRDDEMTVLMAHLQEARRPNDSVENDARRLREEIGLKNIAFEELTKEAAALKAALERTRAQLEEREFLIRRLEHSESNNANVLGRIQTSMERLGSAATGAQAPDWSPELIRLDGDRSVSHTLGRRTRVGRAPGCELHIDSSAVSRHHALILAGAREAVIEDLNSTNGVFLNGRKVTRAVLNDGDIVTIGEIQFRYVAKSAQGSAKG